MVDRRATFEGKSLSEVADMMADSRPESDLAHAARAEFLLRQTQFHERAATAAEETSKHTRRYTLYMLWSVIILALSAFGSLLLEFWRFSSGK
jgi:hypothetical protein